MANGCGWIVVNQFGSRHTVGETTPSVRGIPLLIGFDDSAMSDAITFSVKAVFI